MTLSRILFLALIFLLAIGCSQSDYSNKSNDPARLKQDLITLERLSPMDYLSVEYSLDFKILGGKSVINGVIINKASLAEYSDAELEISFISKTGSVIDSYNIIVYEVFPPGEKTKFEHRKKAPKSTKRIGVRLISAKPFIRK